MSILLDALKKSEEQRQLGKTPDIHGAADHKPEDGDSQLSRWLPAALLAVAAVAITWIVWAQYRAPETAAVSELPQVSQRPAAEVPKSGSDTSAEPARTPVETFVQEPGAATATEADDSARRSEVSRTFNQFQKPTQPGPATTKKQVASQAKQPAAATTADSSGFAAPAEPEKEPVPLQPHVAEPISFWELPQGVRDGMPELRITVMVYAEKPAERFMLVNGQRLVENESIDGVELEEIRRSGAVFRYRNYRFMIKG